MTQQAMSKDSTAGIQKIFHRTVHNIIFAVRLGN
jgi:hypothetical protein